MDGWMHPQTGLAGWLDRIAVVVHHRPPTELALGCHWHVGGDRLLMYVRVWVVDGCRVRAASLVFL